MPKKAVNSSELPPAVAYLRIEDDANEYQFAVLLKEIAVYCQREGLRLIQSFTDQGYSGETAARPGLIELLETLKETAGLVVVVPTLDHLSPNEIIRNPVVFMVQGMGARLAAVDETDGDTGDLSAPHSGAMAEPEATQGELP